VLDPGLYAFWFAPFETWLQKGLCPSAAWLRAAFDTCKRIGRGSIGSGKSTHEIVLLYGPLFSPFYAGAQGKGCWHHHPEK
jgi:hypothetical protein